jgi:hypothetical protein
MRITFEQTGGFAGMTITKVFDTSALPEKQAKRLRQLVDAAAFFNLPANLTSDTPYPDSFDYLITVEDEGKQHTVELSESAAPPNLTPLLEWLRVQKS